MSLVPRPSFSAGQTAGEVTPVEYIVGGDLPTRNIGLRVASSLAIPEIVATTDLIATLSTRLVLPLVKSGELQRFDPPFNNIGFEFRLYWHKVGLKIHFINGLSTSLLNTKIVFEVRGTKITLNLQAIVFPLLGRVDKRLQP